MNTFCSYGVKPKWLQYVTILEEPETRMSDNRKPMANIAPFGLRMQPDLKIRVEKAARENNRSLNAEIVQRLEDSFGKDEIGRTVVRVPDELVARMSQAWGIVIEEPARTTDTVEALLVFLGNQFPAETLDIFHYRLAREIDTADDEDQKQKLVDAANKYAEKKWPNIVFTLSTHPNGRRRLIMETRQR